MAKILYDNGTEVAFRDKNTPMRYRVHRYHKGSIKPYELKSVKYPNRGTVRANVKEIISWANHPYNKNRNDDDGEVRTVRTPTTASNGLSHDEVAKIVREEINSALLQNNIGMNESFQGLHDHLVQDAEFIADRAIAKAKTEVDETE
jgi:hypothetical protein